MWARALLTGHFGSVEPAMALGGSVRPLLHLSGAGPLVDSTRVVAEPRPYECAVDSALGQQRAHAADTYQWGLDRFGTAEQFVHRRAHMASHDPLGSAAEAPRASSGSSAPHHRYYPGKRDLVVTALAERLGIATDIVMLATQSVRWSIVSDALRVLTSSLHQTELTAQQRTDLHDVVALALQRPRGLAELLRACASVVRSSEMTPALFLTIIAEDVGIRRRFGPLVDDVELFSMLFEHLGPRGSGRYQGNAELLYVLEMARRGQRVTRVNPHGPPHEYRCDFALPDATGDTLVEIKRCFGGAWNKDLQGKTLHHLRYAARQIEVTQRTWAQQVVQQVVVLFFQQQLFNMMLKARFAPLRTRCRPLLNGHIRLQVAFLPLYATMEPVTLYDV